MSLKDKILKSEFTRSDVAWALGVSEETVFAWEEGLATPSLEDIYDMAKFLNVNFRELAIEAGYTHNEIDSFFRMRGVPVAYGPSDGPAVGQ